MLAKASWRQVTWRRGTKEPLRVKFAAARVRVADGPAVYLCGQANQHLPGDEVWMRDLLGGGDDLEGIGFAGDLRFPGDTPAHACRPRCRCCFVPKTRRSRHSAAWLSLDAAHMGDFRVNAGRFNISLKSASQ